MIVDVGIEKLPGRKKWSINAVFEGRVVALARFDSVREKDAFLALNTGYNPAVSAEAEAALKALIKRTDNGTT